MWQKTWHTLCEGWNSLFKVSCGGVRLNPLGTSATNWPIVPTPYDRWLWSIWWNENWQGKLKYLEETCLSATLCTTNSTCPDLGSNPGHRGGNPATNHLSWHGLWSTLATIVPPDSCVLNFLGCGDPLWYIPWWTVCVLHLKAFIIYFQ
jgi:hypothetical protein